MNDVKGSDRVSIEKKVHELYIELSRQPKKSAEDAPFILMKDVFMWAVSLGVERGKRRKLIGSKEQIFRWDQFSQDIDTPALKAIALAETQDIEVLTDEAHILRIAEEFANEGIWELKSRLLDKPGKALWNLVDDVRS
jgi:dnd system-associated protein 4